MGPAPTVGAPLAPGDLMRRRTPSQAPQSAEPSLFAQHLQAARAQLPLCSAAPPASAQRAALRTLGGRFGAFVQAASMAMQEGGEPYAALPAAAHALPAQLEKLRQLEKAKEGLLELLGSVSAEIGASRVAIARGVKLVEDTTAEVLQRPGTEEPLRRRVEGASRDLRALRAGLSGRRKASAQRSRALKTGFACLQAEAPEAPARDSIEGERPSRPSRPERRSGEPRRLRELSAPPAALANRSSRRRPPR